MRPCGTQNGGTLRSQMDTLLMSHSGFSFAAGWAAQRLLTQGGPSSNDRTEKEVSVQVQLRLMNVPEGPQHIRSARLIEGCGIVLECKFLSFNVGLAGQALGACCRPQHSD